MKRNFSKVGLVAALGLASTLLAPIAAQAADPAYSVWLVENSRFMKVPFGAFQPDRAFVPGAPADGPNGTMPIQGRISSGCAPERLRFRRT